MDGKVRESLFVCFYANRDGADFLIASIARELPLLLSLTGGERIDGGIDFFDAEEGDVLLVVDGDLEMEWKWVI